MPNRSFGRISDNQFKCSFLKGIINVSDVDSIVFLFYELSGYIREQFIKEIMEAFPSFDFIAVFKSFLKDYTGINEDELLAEVCEVLSEVLGVHKELDEKDLYIVEPDMFHILIFMMESLTTF